ncbi:MAG: hypothetical protein AB1631_28820 [Acidobacteriota bacterium]
MIIVQVLFGIVILLIVLVALSGVIGILKDGAMRVRTLVALLVVAAGLGWYLFDQARKNRRETLRNFVASNLAEIDISPPSDNQASEPYLIGKLVVVDREKQTIDDLFNALPSDMKADHPSEVRTVVLLTWTQEEVGYYEGTNKMARRWHCSVTAIDLSARRRLVEKDIIGPMPPAFIRPDDKPSGDRPDKKVIEFLTSLPRRSA